MMNRARKRAKRLCGFDGILTRQGEKGVLY